MKIGRFQSLQLRRGEKQRTIESKSPIQEQKLPDVVSVFVLYFFVVYLAVGRSNCFSVFIMYFFGIVFVF